MGLIFIERIGIRRARPTRRVGKKVSGGHFLSAGENPWKADGVPVGMLAAFRLCMCWVGFAFHEMVHHSPQILNFQNDATSTQIFLVDR